MSAATEHLMRMVGKGLYDGTNFLAGGGGGGVDVTRKFGKICSKNVKSFSLLASKILLKQKVPRNRLIRLT